MPLLVSVVSLSGEEDVELRLAPEAGAKVPAAEAPEGEPAPKRRRVRRVASSSSD